MFDAHCHLSVDRMEPSADMALKLARQVGVTGFLLAGIDPQDWDRQLELTTRHSDVVPCFGVHPQRVGEIDDDEAHDMVMQLASRLGGPPSLRPRALGELGLDRAICSADSLPRQIQAFRAQLALAREADLPIVLHILRAQEAALTILEADGVPQAGGMVHSFSGPAEMVKRYVRLGLMISFAGPVTYGNARRALEACRAVPLDHLLVETDAPDQTPEPYRPGPNQPAYLPAIIHAVAKARNVPDEVVAEATSSNARRMLGWIG